MTFDIVTLRLSSLDHNARIRPSSASFAIPPAKFILSDQRETCFSKPMMDRVSRSMLRLSYFIYMEVMTRGIHRKKELLWQR